MDCCDIAIIVAAFLGVVLGIWAMMYVMVIAGLIVLCPFASSLDVCGWWPW